MKTTLRELRRMIRQCLLVEGKCQYCGANTPYLPTDEMPCPECADRLKKDPDWMPDKEKQPHRPDVNQPLPVKRPV